MFANRPEEMSVLYRSSDGMLGKRNTIEEQFESVVEFVSVKT